MKKVVVYALMGLFVFAFAVNAETFVYPEEDPFFAISFPDKWKIEAEDEMLHAGPPDDSIYLGLWALQDADDLDGALEALDEAISSYFSELELGDPEEIEINEIPFVTIDGAGVLEEGATEVSISVALFLPAEDQIFILLYFGTPESEEKYENDLVEIIGSIEKK